MSDNKPHPLHRAWAGGVFDARITFPRSGYVLRFESTDEHLMRRFAEVVGVGKLEPHNKKQCSHTVWCYRTLKMDDTRELLLMVAPFLSTVRMKQASEMVARIERNPVWQKQNPEKVTLSATYPAKPAEAETTQDSTLPDGPSASDAE